MNQGDAAVWAAGMGIAGTLTAALGGPLLQARAARRQAREQEAVDIRHRLREERRAAYKAVLDACDGVQRAINVIIETLKASQQHQAIDRLALREQMDSALDRLYRAVTDVEITGPRRMGELAVSMLAAEDQQAAAWRPFLGIDDGRELSVDESQAHGAQAIEALREARTEFILRAQQAMLPQGSDR
ncbi:hypothetical protein [Streptomyces sp. NPDC094468]|uniref:hypothetical protein n=1 Tax=Streptomyces sp. NPDC094468 TaxID=3366066 RepID=UPI0037F343E1